MAVRRLALAIFEKRLVARVRPENLVALGASVARVRDRARTDDPSFRDRLVEAWKGRVLGALEADSAVALGVGAAGLSALAGVDPAAPLRRCNLLGKTIADLQQSEKLSH